MADRVHPEPTWRLPLLLLTVLLGTCFFDLGTVAADQPAVPLRPSGIDGALLLAGGSDLPEAVAARFIELAGGPKARLVIIPTASEKADKEPAETFLAPWKARKLESVQLLHTRSRKTADEASFLEPLRKATGVWIRGGDQGRLADVYLGTGVEKELSALLQRGGVVGAASAGAAVLSRVMIASGKETPKLTRGFDLLPGAIVDQHFHRRKRQPRLQAALEANAGLFGVGLDEKTALEVRGRQMRVLGEGTVTLMLAAGAGRPIKSVELKAKALADLTTWRRAAIARTKAPFPPKNSRVPEVPKGALVIVGGGGAPMEIVRKFIELAGGPDALIVVLPTAMPEPLPKVGEVAMLERAGARNVKLLPARERKDVEDGKSLDLLRKAKGIWFGGGRQWRFVDAYEGTKALPLFFDVLNRGGVIGGSSAGASIQAEYMVRGSPLGNLEMMCEGYERGLGFLPGVAVDQHFAQRNRFADMTAFVKTYPQLLGIGIDESTAIIVRGHVAEVLGRNKVQFYDRNKPVEEGQPDYEVVKSGGRYDLKERKILKP